VRDRRELFSQKVRAESRTYFLDVKETRNGSKYLVISESRERGGNQERNRVWVFEEHLESFYAALTQVVDFLDLNPKTSTAESDEGQGQYSRSHKQWTPEEDEALSLKYDEGLTIAELATLLKREASIIRTRLLEVNS
jgi:DNA-directed RNA polymerase specialized sigma24 family protein